MNFLLHEASQNEATLPSAVFFGSAVEIYKKVKIAHQHIFDFLFRKQCYYSLLLFRKDETNHNTNFQNLFKIILSKQCCKLDFKGVVFD